MSIGAMFSQDMFRWWSGLAIAAVLCAMPSGTALALQSELMPLAEQSLLLDGQVVGERIVVVGERGHILVSTDQGRTWDQRPAPTRATLTSLFFADADNGWAAGHDSVILRTRDGGQHWQLVHSDPSDIRPILDLWFRDLVHGCAVGAYGLLLTTDDGGESWQAQDFHPKSQVSRRSGGGTATAEQAEAEEEEEEEEEEEAWGIDYHFNQISATSDGRLYVAAEAGHFYRSDDACRSWIELPSPYEGSFYGSLPLHKRELLLFGLRGHLFRSEDAGVSWHEIPTGVQATLNDGLRLQDGRIVLVGLAGTVLVSDDDGASFRLLSQGDRAGIAKVLETSDGTLLLLGEQGVKRLNLAADGEGER